MSDETWRVQIDLDPIQPARVMKQLSPLDFVTIEAVSGDRESLEWLLEHVRDRIVSHTDVELVEEGCKDGIADG